MVTKFDECINKLDARNNIKDIIKEVSDRMNENEELRYSFEDFMEEERRINDSIINDEKRKSKEEGHQEGFAEGHQEGFTEGHQEGLREGEEKIKNIVNQMIKKGLLMEDILSYTGLSIDEIKKITKEKQ